MQISHATPPQTAQKQNEQALKRLAIELEVTFLSEMLKSSGLETAGKGFASGIGEDQFSSFLRRERADAMAQTGGIGLAEQIFETLKATGEIHDNG